MSLVNQPGRTLRWPATADRNYHGILLEIHKKFGQWSPSGNGDVRNVVV